MSHSRHWLIYSKYCDCIITIIIIIIIIIIIMGMHYPTSRKATCSQPNEVIVMYQFI
jgi:hypothetical protein